MVPEVLVTGGGGGSLDGLAASLIRYLGSNGRGAGRPEPAVNEAAAASQWAARAMARMVRWAMAVSDALSRRISMT